MSIIKEVVKETARNAAIIVGAEAVEKTAVAVKDAADKAGTFISTSSERRKIRKANELGRYQEKMEKKNPDNAHLWLMEESTDVKSSFFKTTVEITYKFVDMDGIVVYSAVCEQRMNEQFVTLYDAEGYELGGIAESKTRIRNAFKVKNDENAVNLEMFYKDEPMGLVTNNVWKGNWFLIWDIVNWGAERKKVGVTNVVTADGKLIAEITTKIFNSNNLTFLDIEDPSQEKAVVLFALAIVAYNASK